jgi:hypothetical protein
MVPDSDSIRSARARRHAKGDHSMCRRPRCPDAPAEPGSVESAIRRVVDDLPFEGDDPRIAMSALAISVAQAIDDRPTAALSAELRAVVSAITQTPNDEPDQIDDLRLRHGRRRVEAALRAAEGL